MINKSRLSPEEQEKRKPMSPDALVDALQDTVHVDLGKSRIAKSVKVGRGENIARASENVKKIFSEMPPWQRDYAEAIVASTTSPSTDDSFDLPTMFK